MILDWGEPQFKKPPASGLRMYLKRIEESSKSLEGNKAGVVIGYATWRGEKVLIHMMPAVMQDWFECKVGLQHSLLVGGCNSEFGS